VNLEKFDRAFGKIICDKYLKIEKDLPDLWKHSYQVAELCYNLASAIIAKNGEFKKELNPEFLSFLGYVHNIGIFIKRERHELHTIYLLTKKEGIPDEIALMTRHGQLAEDYAGDGEDYLPIGLTGIILTYADISAREGPIITIQDRTQEMIRQMEQKQGLFKDYSSDMIQRFKAAIPRYQRYEAIINCLR
jgi:hypothetical protein